MSTLLLRLAAPLQSWGIDSKFDIRRTGREPNKSGVIGLICAALGIKRDDDEMVSQLATLRFGVRVDKEGHFVRDFHMVRSKKGESYVTNRYYLADAEFLVGFESVDEELLKKIEYALLNPVFPLYLGRRSCPPTGRLCLGIRKLELEEALLEEEFRNESIETVRIVMDAKKGEDGNIVKDLPISYNPEHRKHMFRKVTEKYRAVREPLQCHDPMAELG